MIHHDSNDLSIRESLIRLISKTYLVSVSNRTHHCIDHSEVFKVWISNNYLDQFEESEILMNHEDTI